MIHDPIEEIWLYQSQVATSRDTTLKNKDHGGVILTSHDTSEKMDGLRSTRKSGNLSDTTALTMATDDQIQSRVRFNVKNSVETFEPDAWK